MKPPAMTVLEEVSPTRSFEEFLEAHLGQEMLRFTTAGSVDDGKSTLIGRLLHDTKSVYEDQLAAVKQSRVNREQRVVFWTRQCRRGHSRSFWKRIWGRRCSVLLRRGAWMTASRR